MKNSTRFLNAFVSIEEYLRQKTANQDGHMGFSQMIRYVGKKEKAVSTLEYDLKEFAQLRNAIIHERAGDEVIAEPNDLVVKAIEHAAEMINRPPTVFPLFKRQVITIQPDTVLRKALKIMYSSGVSKLPVIESGECVGVLTSNIITRWLGDCVENNAIEFDATMAATVLKFGRKRDRYTFISRRTDLFSAIDMFEDYERKGQRLHAILITENGKQMEKILGIMTVSDLPKAIQAVDQ
ncbi:MAG: CBS domain-containing protein [Chloroflexota bacterium]